MNLGNFFGKVKKVLSVLTDLLLVGRNRGWWKKAPTPGVKRDKRRKK